MTPPRPAHTKIEVGGVMQYACVLHAEKVAQLGERLAREVQTVRSSERDSASVWCNFCEGETA